MLYPLTFRPVFKERVWGGRALSDLFRKPLPEGKVIGESWEISDRPGDVSVIANGPLAGRDLHWLVEQHGPALLGNEPTSHGRFPLLVKILDAQEKLSLQVHPPAAMASELGGEPKTEMWYIAAAKPGAELYVGLRKGVTRSEFVQHLENGSVSGCFHRIPVKAGDAMFLPSGRVHAIGAGLVIFEIQQNSDTTYRVYDWDRLGLDGKPRELHVQQSLASIDFEDVEPALAPANYTESGGIQVRPLVSDSLFSIRSCRLQTGRAFDLKPGKMHIIAAVSGEAVIVAGNIRQPLANGEFCLVPAGLAGTQVQAVSQAEVLHIVAGPSFE